MPSDKCNVITAKVTSLIFSLFDITSAQWHTTVDTMHSQFLMDLPVSSFVSHSSLLTAISINLAVASLRNVNRPYFS